MSEGQRQTILVLGASGMLGHVLVRFLAGSTDRQVIGAVRSHTLPEHFPVALAPLIHTGIDATDAAALRSLLHATRPQVVINCIGLIKQRPECSDPEQAILSNALIPHRIARLCADIGARMVHISTDCVFSGANGNYTEDSLPDCTDMYGRTKLLGEVTNGDAVTLRTSIIGPELERGHGLLSWFLAQTGKVPGYRSAIFSGLPTVELARVVRDYVLPRRDLRGLFHVSAQPISKLHLLELIQRAYGTDAVVVAQNTVSIDRSLNSELFRRITGYAPPSWPTLVETMKAFG